MTATQPQRNIKNEILIRRYLWFCVMFMVWYDQSMGFFMSVWWKQQAVDFVLCRAQLMFLQKKKQNKTRTRFTCTGEQAKQNENLLRQKK